MTKAEFKKLKRQARIKNKAISEAYKANNLKLSLNGKTS